MSTINQTDRARLVWQALVAAARQRQTMTYGALGAQIGVHHRALRYALSPIQDYCLETGLPPLTILVVNGSGRPGSGFIAHDADDLENGFEAVWGHSWSQELNPFDFAAGGLSYDALFTTLTNNPDEAEHVYNLVKSRGVRQLLFRDAVKKAYSLQCAFTGLRFPDALEACHIVPWAMSTPQQRMDVRNGILLNSLHHRLFDKAYLTITPDYRIAYFDPAGAECAHTDMEATLTIKLHGQAMHVPRLLRHRPLAENIEQHNVMLEWEFAQTGALA